MARPRSNTRYVRWAIQAAMVALVAWLGIRHQLTGGAASPLDSYCPFGGVETLPALLGGKGLIGKVGTSNLVLLAALAIMTLGVSGAFCGWLCPFGAIQDLLAGIGRRLFGRRVQIVPMAVHRYLKYLRWAVLALIVWMSAKYLTLWFATYDPFRAMFHFKFETTLSIVLVVVTVIGGLVIERFFCLYACPLGALVGGLGLLGVTAVRRAEESCTNCTLCARACPSRIAVDHAQVVRDQHCTMCTECVEACPQPGALVLSTGARGEAFRPLAVGIAAVAIFFAVIGTGWALGWWQGGRGCAGCASTAEQGAAAPLAVPATAQAAGAVPAALE